MRGLYANARVSYPIFTKQSHFQRKASEKPETFTSRATGGGTLPSVRRVAWRRLSSCNVILLTGEGMGFGQARAAGMCAHGAPDTLPLPTPLLWG